MSGEGTLSAKVTVKSRLTEAQQKVIDRDIVTWVGWDAVGLPVVKLADLPGDVTVAVGRPLAVGRNGEPEVPTEPIDYLDGFEPDDAEPVVDLQVRTCGAVHTDGTACKISVMYEPGCCQDIVYPHDGPHESHMLIDGRDVITHRWNEVLVIQDLPFNCYGPICEGKDDDDDL